jgi:F-type H+-transporting ATPase subunit delta
MADHKVSLRYATSLLTTAVNKNIFEQVAADVEIIAGAMKESPKLKRALKNPVIKPEMKITILEEIFKSKINPETMHFIRFLVKKGREDLLDQVAQKFLELRDEKLGIVNVDVQTAFEMTELQKSELQAKLEQMLNKKVRFKIQTVPDVVGGFVAKVNDTVYDASVKHQLEILKQQLLKGGAALN